VDKKRATDTRLTDADRSKLALALTDFLNEYVGVLDAAIEIYQTYPRRMTDAAGQAMMPYRQNIGINTILLTLRRFDELWPQLLRVLPRDSEARRLGKSILESYRAQKKIVDSYAARDAKQGGQPLSDTARWNMFTDLWSLQEWKYPNLGPMGFATGFARDMAKVRDIIMAEYEIPEVRLPKTFPGGADRARVDATVGEDRTMAEAEREGRSLIRRHRT
jgi:hypothetical protein